MRDGRGCEFQLFSNYSSKKLRTVEAIATSNKLHYC